MNRRYEKQINGYINLERVFGHYLYTYDFEGVSKQIEPINCFEMPLLAHISITDKCNLNCPYCYAYDSTKSKNMELEEFITIIDKLEQAKVMSLIITGGEPLTHLHINEILEYAIKKKFSVLLLTNLHLLSQINNNVLKSPYLAFQISLNGIWSDERKENANLVKTLYNYKRLKELNIPVITTIVIDNIKIDLDDLFEFLQENNITAARFGLLIKMGRGERLQEDYEYIKYVKWVTEEIMKYKNKHPNLYFMVQTEYSDFCESYVARRTTLCEAGISELFVDTNGDVYPCPLFKCYKDFYCGNLLINSTEQVWKTEVMNKFRKISLDKMGCGDCNNKCGVWCRGLVYSYTKKLESKSPFCVNGKKINE